MNDLIFSVKTISNEAADAIVEARSKRAVIERVAVLRGAWNAPKRQSECKVSTEGEWGDKLDILSPKVGSGMIVAFTGNRGNGKTQLAVELMRLATSKLVSSYFLTATEFFMLVKSTYRKDSGENEFQVIQKLRRHGLLVIDEIGKRGETEWENNLLFELVNKRYGDVTDTILIDNRPKSDFVATIGPSLASRINETGGIVECNWPSFR